MRLESDSQLQQMCLHSLETIAASKSFDVGFRVKGRGNRSGNSEVIMQ